MDDTPPDRLSSPVSTTTPTPSHPFSFPAVMAGCLLFSFALFQAITTNNARDFFIFRLGAQLASRGENPYSVPAIRAAVAAEYPRDDKNTREFVDNCGYFLPPMAVMVFLPFAAAPLASAKIGWAIATGIAGFLVSRLPGLSLSRSFAVPSMLSRNLLPFVLILNPLALAVVLVGQFTLISLGCVVAGLMCLKRGRPHVTAILWVLPFIKPHVALPLILVLWLLGGWRPAALLLFLVLILNLMGATVVGGSPLFLVDYLTFLSDSHKTVGYNRVELNPSITSWNRLLYACGGPLVELTGLTTVAAYVVWFVLAFGRVAISRTRPSSAWIVAVAAVGSVFCAQVLVYELLILLLLVPWLGELFASRRRLPASLAVALLTLQLIPQATYEQAGIFFPPALGVALLAVLVLVTGGREVNGK